MDQEDHYPHEAEDKRPILDEPTDQVFATQPFRPTLTCPLQSLLLWFSILEGHDDILLLGLPSSTLMKGLCQPSNGHSNFTIMHRHGQSLAVSASLDLRRRVIWREDRASGQRGAEEIFLHELASQLHV